MSILKISSNMKPINTKIKFTQQSDRKANLENADNFSQRTVIDEKKAQAIDMLSNSMVKKLQEIIQHQMEYNALADKLKEVIQGSKKQPEPEQEPTLPPRRESRRWGNIPGRITYSIPEIY